MIDTGLIIEQTRQIVGVDHAIPFSDVRATGHRQLLGDFPEPDTGPLAVLMPDSVEQIQSLIKLAGTLGYAITTIPNAAGNGAGLLAPKKPTVVLDFDRMNEIIEFNADSGYALVEPGVSFDQLRAHIDESGSSHWVDCDENGANSVSGSVSQRAFGYTPYGDHLLMQCGMEVVTANGEVLRTGMGALPGSDTWQLFKYNYGPYLDGLFSRSDLAVMTKVGVWLMPTPPAYHPFMVTLPDTGALERAVEVLRDLKIQMIVPNTVIISHRSADAELLRASGVTTRISGQAEWNLYGALYGIAENVQVTWGMVRAALGSIPYADISTSAEPSQHPAWPLRTQLMRGEPVYSRTAEKMERTLWFAAAAPMEGEAAATMQQIVQGSFARSEIAYSYQYALTWRTMFMQVSIAYTPESFTAHRDATLTVIEQLTAAGYAISHDSRELTAAVGAAHTGEGLRHLYTSLDAALDPERILRGGW